MQFDTGKAYGIVEVDRIYHTTGRFTGQPLIIGKKDEGTDHAVTYLLKANGVCNIARTGGVVDPTPEGKAKNDRAIKEMCYQMLYG